MRGGAPGPNGWQVLWAGAGHGFLIQSRTQEWRQGEFAVGKLNLLNISGKYLFTLCLTISLKNKTFKYKYLVIYIMQSPLMG